MSIPTSRPTSAFIGASWAALFIGALTYMVGLWNAAMLLNEKGYYFTILVYGGSEPTPTWMRSRKSNQIP